MVRGLLFLSGVVALPMDPVVGLTCRGPGVA